MLYQDLTSSIWVCLHIPAVATTKKKRKQLQEPQSDNGAFINISSQMCINRNLEYIKDEPVQKSQSDVLVVYVVFALKSFSVFTQSQHCLFVCLYLRVIQRVAAKSNNNFVIFQRLQSTKHRKKRYQYIQPVTLNFQTSRSQCYRSVM